MKTEPLIAAGTSLDEPALEAVAPAAGVPRSSKESSAGGGVR